MTDDPNEATPSDVLHLAQTALGKANRLDSELKPSGAGQRRLVWN